ncbi:MAG: GNAT family N-acetyltransferase [Saccharofermentans sp.]|nr:GNAT family N-acetyltransferase [Saccharofermentans sp.]
MKTKLIELTEDNLKECLALKVSGEQAAFIATNEASWNAAKENPDVARPYAIYCDGKMVGFTMFAFDLTCEGTNDRYWLWRFMIDESMQGKGYGTAALQMIIRYFRDHGANNIRLSTKEINAKALAMYRKAGFRDTGEIIDGEIVLQMEL